LFSIIASVSHFVLRQQFPQETLTQFKERMEVLLKAMESMGLSTPDQDQQAADFLIRLNDRYASRATAVENNCRLGGEYLKTLVSFFCPTTGKIISSLDYVFDPTVAAGPHFGYTFMPTTHFGFIGQRGPATVSAPLHPPGSIVYPLVPCGGESHATDIAVPVSPDTTATVHHNLSHASDRAVSASPATVLDESEFFGHQVVPWIY
jgi:hypothetical protein